MTKKQTGNLGEQLACKYLEQNKYQILNRNFYSYHGEIDIIAKKANEIIFIEVKTRTNCTFGRPIEAVDDYKMRHIFKVARYYLYITNQENTPTRFDVIEIFISNGKFTINHIKQVI